MKKLFLVMAATAFLSVACDKRAPKAEGPGSEVTKEDILDFPDLEIPDGLLEVKRRVDIPLSDAQMDLAERTVDFSFRLLREADKTFESVDNLTLSPLSASFVLSMLANGADGETRREIVDVLGFEGAGLSAVNEYSGLMLKTLPDLDNTGVLSFANSLWLNSGYGAGGFDVYDSFEESLEDVYDSEIHAYDFAEGPGLINAWCSKKTNNLISDILKELNPESQMVLANALYFKGIWETPFAVGATGKEEFINDDGRTVTVDMMNCRTRTPYAVTDDYAMAELAYGNGAFSFQIILPAEGAGVYGCLEGITAGDWLAVQSEKQYRDLSIKLPKFKVEMNVPFSELLESMGMRKMFSPVEADFSCLSGEASYVSGVQQATCITVDEEGTEAAAVTILGMDSDTGTDPKEPEYIPFHVTRPFLFLIKEHSTNTILFIGKVSKL